MKCPRCLNEEQKYFYLGEKGYYCRRCILFGRIYFDEEFDESEILNKELEAEYELGFQLTEAQENCSKEINKMIKHSDVLVYAACGVGKTELVLEVISDYLSKGKRVGFAIPRRQVVLELQKRMAQYFKQLKVIKVCGGYTKEVEGDLIICTTHQLYRYRYYFDLLILDEPDAYPYYGSSVLQGIAKTSCKGRKIFLSATPDAELLKLPKVTLFKRPHEYPLNVPEVKIGFAWYLSLRLICFMYQNKRNLIFVPTISLAERMAKIFHTVCLHSKTEEKEIILEKFDKNEINTLFCTTILERGVTIENVNVCIWLANHRVYSEASLIQILGRIGRSVHYPMGKGLLLCNEKSENVFKCIQTLKMMNA